MKRPNKLDSRMPTRWHFGDVVAKLMKTHDPPLNQAELAQRSGVNQNTIGNLINGTYQPTPDTQGKVAAALGTNRETILAEVDRLNSAENVLPLRSGKDRDYDRDPMLSEAMQYARRITTLPPLARMTVYQMIAALEEAYRRSERNDRTDRNDRDRADR